jgi:hypothetical protein
VSEPEAAQRGFSCLQLTAIAALSKARGRTQHTQREHSQFLRWLTQWVLCGLQGASTDVKRDHSALSCIVREVQATLHVLDVLVARGLDTRSPRDEARVPARGRQPPCTLSGARHTARGTTTQRQPDDSQDTSVWIVCRRQRGYTSARNHCNAGNTPQRRPRTLGRQVRRDRSNAFTTTV